MNLEPYTAVALEYDGKEAPIVTAKGDDLLAKDIIQIAEQHGIPIYHDAGLAKLLSQIELDEAIPKNLYVVIARIIAFAYMLNGKVPEGFVSG